MCKAMVIYNTLKLRYIYYLGFIIFFTNNLLGQDIIISENFINHPYCTKLDKISTSSINKTKKELYKELYKEAKNLHANVIINTKEDKGFFGTKHNASGIAARCDIGKSKNLYFYPMPSTKKDNIFGVISLFNEDVTMIQDTNNSSQSKSTIGINSKLGLYLNNFELYLNLGLSNTSYSILGSIDYSYKINTNFAISVGLSNGINTYQISKKNMYANVYGFQLSTRYNNFEIGMQKLYTKDYIKINNITYSPTGINRLFIGYYF